MFTFYHLFVYHSQTNNTLIIMSKPYTIEDYNGINNQLMAHEQRGRHCSEYIESVGNDVRAGDFITFSSVT
jgi:hypothetical protein